MTLAELQRLIAIGFGVRLSKEQAQSVAAEMEQVRADRDALKHERDEERARRFDCERSHGALAAQLAGLDADVAELHRRLGEEIGGRAADRDAYAANIERRAWEYDGIEEGLLWAIQRLEGRLTEAMEVLRPLEFIGGECPECSGIKGIPGLGHDPECRLAKVLAESRP